MIEAKLGRTGLFISLLTIYSDASEALHGTLYGAAFHLGVFDVGSAPYDQESLDRQRYSTLSCLYLMAGGAIDTLLSLLRLVDEPRFGECAERSKASFREVAVKAELAASRAG